MEGIRPEGWIIGHVGDGGSFVITRYVPIYITGQPLDIGIAHTI